MTSQQSAFLLLENAEKYHDDAITYTAFHVDSARLWKLVHEGPPHLHDRVLAILCGAVPVLPPVPAFGENSSLARDQWFTTVRGWLMAREKAAEVTSALTGLRWLAEELADESTRQDRSQTRFWILEGDHTAALVDQALEASRRAFDLARVRFKVDALRGDAAIETYAAWATSVRERAGITMDDGPEEFLCPGPPSPPTCTAPPARVSSSRAAAASWAAPSTGGPVTSPGSSCATSATPPR